MVAKALGKIAVFALILALLLSPACACAEAELDLEAFEYYAGDPIPANDPDIINFKGRLNEQGFYISGASEEVLHSTTLDAETMAAVKLVCDLNPELRYFPDGVTRILCWRVMGTYGDPLRTPLDGVYEALAPGSSGEAVSKVQARLDALGYGEAAGFVYTPGVYDEALQRAVDAFAEANAFAGEREDGISAELQELLFSEGAKAWEGSRGAGLIGYLRGSSRLFGFELPNVAVLILCFALLCVIVVLAMKLFSSNEPRPGGTDALPGIRFQVEYGGASCAYSASLKSPIAIGRAVGDFPLNPSDGSVSRDHCEIRLDGGRVILTDHSTFGTKINGRLCHNCRESLQPNDVLEVGEHRITVYFQLK